MMCDAVAVETFLKNIIESDDDKQHQQIRKPFRGTMTKILQNLNESAIRDPAANADCNSRTVRVSKALIW